MPLNTRPLGVLRENLDKCVLTDVVTLSKLYFFVTIVGRVVLIKPQCPSMDECIKKF